jgi:hypothetical protein
MMDAAEIFETSVNSYGATTHKTAIFILAAVRTSNLTHCDVVFRWHKGIAPRTLLDHKACLNTPLFSFFVVLLLPFSVLFNLILNLVVVTGVGEI